MFSQYSSLKFEVERVEVVLSTGDNVLLRGFENLTLIWNYWNCPARTGVLKL